MAKKKKAPLLEAWCWYCDREFEDEKVLLQHQKAKHYKCPHCPRRLNTAGGLTVHLHQVHKAEPTFIENALPGRESFDVEIYGMTGIPAADLEEWKSRRGRSTGQDPSNPSGQPSAKRPKVESVALTPAQLKAQLEAHKALMAGKSHAEAAAAAAGAGAGAGGAASSAAAGPSSAASPLPPHLAYPGPPPPFGPPPGFNP
ncbi:hypothetical protein IE81DRAFT_294162 [Ceraceosorus guamensis]|uniref:C2H2-type domain-containing protein n=1 Tax=Ceraceosorus guamensis TaxID=1522189 RepID=A0A316VS42_9BASI|nr:hypothetical protein IE81DRAFT_294162 [Ceraceosorus guamensis]PWN39868.1 hypothetical protein IE81DRAFT_294162 [Ceraceosorus guamensis]